MAAVRWLAVGAGAIAGLGCATNAPLSDYERCGLQRMELDGVTITRGSVYHSHYVGGRFVPGGATVRGRGVVCRLPPRDDDERICEVAAYRAAAVFKMNNKRYSRSALQEVSQESDAVWERAYESCINEAEGDTDEGG
jgi:hypothetical protein